MMEEGSSKTGEARVSLPGVGEQFQVEDFAKTYERFLSANPSARPRLKVSALLLVIIGSLATVNGLLTFGMGRRYIVIDLFSSGFDFYSIRIHFIFALLLGVSILLIGLAMFKEGAGVSAERFLAERYEVVSDQGVLAESAYSLKYLGKNQFLVTRRLGVKTVSNS